MDICARCYRRLPWIASACVQCAIPLAADGSGDLRCGQCLLKPPEFDSSLSLFSYEQEAITLIHQLKFDHRLACARLLGNMLADTVARSVVDLPERIVPVPLHSRRLRQRGFNQAAELARAASKRFDIPLDVHSVVRRRDTVSQTGLDKTRRRSNIRGAFEILAPLQVDHVAIVDDVVTTQATVNELARLVKRAGVGRVDVWSVARAV